MPNDFMRPYRVIIRADKLRGLVLSIWVSSVIRPLLGCRPA
jgi:hypothetical protein